MEALSVGNAGWVRYETGDLAGYLRLVPDSRGRWVVREIVMDASDGEPITTAALHAVPVAKIETYVNTDPAVRDSLAARFDLVAPVGGPPTGSNVAVLASHFATTLRTRTDPATNWVAAAQASTAQDGRKIGKRAAPHRQAADTSYRLTAAPSAGLTDEFLTAVARAYAAATARGEPPNRTIATDAQVPQRTAERWVYLARQRKVMPPARKGSRG
jgi:hypothetical protein